MYNIDFRSDIIQIDLSDFSDGLYFIKIRNSNYTWIERIIKI
ncbi:MAG: T9SS type A sorting domain-containing protein [Bacteroidia bacterium]|nr:T9SS type A sorting domain-containing protein [Bacteroidia bacterium]